MKYSKGYWSDIEAVCEKVPNIERLFSKTVLVTGASGMVCSPLIDMIIHLNNTRNANINIIMAARDQKTIDKRFGEVLKQHEYHFVKYDSTKTGEMCVEADFVIHGASNSSPKLYSEQPVETIMSNVIGLDSLLRMLSRLKRGRLLYVSSSEVYGNGIVSEMGFREDDYGYVDILNPRACYPMGKRAAETICASYGAEYDVDVVIVRLGHIYGPTITEKDDRASASFTRDALAGNDIVMKSPGLQKRSYCYSLDSASGIMAVLLNGESSRAYNISNRDSIVTIRDMADALAKEAGVAVSFANPTDKEKAGYNLMENSSLNSDRIESLGWEAVFDLPTGAKRTISILKGECCD